MRILALDVGDKRIGLALSDPSGMLASPFRVLQRVGPRKDPAEVARIAAEQGAERILVGIPLSMDGVARAQAQAVQAFCEALRARTPVPIITWDERLTTVEAQRRLRQAGAKGQRRRERDDAVAAAVLLQAYLDSLRVQREWAEGQGEG